MEEHQAMEREFGKEAIAPTSEILGKGFTGDALRHRRKLAAIIRHRAPYTFECFNCGTRYGERDVKDHHNCPKCNAVVVPRNF